MHHKGFVHLHLHTQYSLLDGANRIDDLVKKAREFGMPALAITDHGNMFGAIEFYQKAEKAGIKPIIGCEMYVARGGMTEKPAGGASEAANHLVLLARNMEGYRNLMQLVSMGYKDGFYYKPRIDKAALTQYSGGLIGLSACLKGEVAARLLSGDRAGAREAALEYRRILGAENFYLELQDNGLPEQKKVNELMVELSAETHIPLVATSDCHYFRREESRAHEALLCIQTGKTMNDPHRMRFQTDEFYFKSPEEMASSFEFVPEALANTVKVAERCNLLLNFKEYHLPHYEVPAGYTKESYLEELARKGLDERLAANGRLDPVPYKKRLESELRMIESMGFAGYFLVVWDFIRYARERGIPVGPGRGSAAGSLVAYSLRITDLDPLPYGLLFERFLNPERISMPDIDIDFCMDRRDEVISYVREKYGHDHVSQIITFGTMLARAAIRDVGRVLDIPYGEVDKVAKLVPERLNITLDEALAQEPRLREQVDTDPRIKELIETAKVLEGITRHASKHAAGVVISEEPLTNYTPLYKDNNGDIVTQYAKDEIEKIGLVKFDFLGLRTLTVIDNAVKLINAGLAPGAEPFSLAALPMQDKRTYDRLTTGDTVGVFQLESSGMRDLVMKIKPSCFEDLIPLVALYRPGPINSGMVQDFIDRRHGRTPVKYDLPQEEEVLKGTYGVMVYQEQVMQLAVTLAGFTLGQADTLRKAMGKKQKDVMSKMKESFVQGSVKNGIAAKKAEHVFENMEKFAEYGFNKSHSAAYSLVTYQTAYLKAHHRVEYMAALLSSEMDDTDKIVKYISYCRELGLQVLPPDVNSSRADFTVKEGSILFGLAAVKNVGLSAIESILEAREKQGSFTSIFDFCRKVDLRKVNKRVIEGLIRCGAFDSTGGARSKMAAVLDKAMEGGGQLARERQAGQVSMFDLMGGAEEGAHFDEYPDIAEWNEGELLAHEKETLGFYITGHPLARFVNEARRYANNTTDELAELPDGREVTIIGVKRAIRVTPTKKGDKMAYVTLEDLNGTVEAIVFPELYKSCADALAGDVPLLVTGNIDKGEKGVKLKTTKVALLSEIRQKMTSRVEIRINAVGSSADDLLRLREVIQKHRGSCPLYINIDTQKHGGSHLSIRAGKDNCVAPTEDLINEVEAFLGQGSVKFG